MRPKATLAAFCQQCADERRRYASPSLLSLGADTMTPWRITMRMRSVKPSGTARVDTTPMTTPIGDRLLATIQLTASIVAVMMTNASNRTPSDRLRERLQQADRPRSNFGHSTGPWAAHPSRVNPDLNRSSRHERRSPPAHRRAAHRRKRRSGSSIDPSSHAPRPRSLERRSPWS